MSTIKALLELQKRVADLDVSTLKNQQLADNLNTDMTHFVKVMDRISSAGTPQNIQAYILAMDADAIQRNSHLLARLERAVPEIVKGPIRLGSQYWVGTGKPSFLPKHELTLSESQFIDISTAPDIKPSTKPFCVGLFTATGGLGSYGMWRIYLELSRGFVFFALPWYTWAVKISANPAIREISSATDWVDFVLSNPRFENGLLYPDWKMVARKYDAIHITLRAIVATQGLYFKTEQGIIDAPYWDVECTFWLHWCFDSVKLVEIVT